LFENKGFNRLSRSFELGAAGVEKGTLIQSNITEK